MRVTPVRESKSAATIRRRRRAPHHAAGGATGSPAGRHKALLDEAWDSGEEDPEPPLQPVQVGGAGLPRRAGVGRPQRGGGVFLVVQDGVIHWGRAGEMGCRGWRGGPRTWVIER